jgi:hypothetical protein
MAPLCWRGAPGDGLPFIGWYSSLFKRMRRVKSRLASTDLDPHAAASFTLRRRGVGAS